MTMKGFEPLPALTGHRKSPRAEDQFLPGSIDPAASLLVGWHILGIEDFKTLVGACVLERRRDRAILYRLVAILDVAKRRKVNLLQFSSVMRKDATEVSRRFRRFTVIRDCNLFSRSICFSLQRQCSPRGRKGLRNEKDGGPI